MNKTSETFSRKTNKKEAPDPNVIKKNTDKIRERSKGENNNK